MFVDLIAAFEKLPSERRKNEVNCAMTGGAPCSPVLMSKFKKTFPKAKIFVNIIIYVLKCIIRELNY